MLSTVFEQDFFVLDQGREEDEMAVVLVEDGSYQGYGYASAEEIALGPVALREVIKRYPGNPGTTKIIQRFLSQNPNTTIISL